MKKPPRSDRSICKCTCKNTLLYESACSTLEELLAYEAVKDSERFWPAFGSCALAVFGPKVCFNAKQPDPCNVYLS